MRKLALTLGALALTLALVTGAAGTGPFGDHPPPPPTKPHEDPKKKKAKPAPKHEDTNRGPTGKRGPAGPRGPRGLRGPEGAAGGTGLPGATGAQGATGAKGDTGPAGAKGDQGNQGIQGIQGIQGTQGVPGPPGTLSEVPSGETLRGAVGADYEASAALGDWGIVASLPMRAPVALGDADVVVDVEGWVAGDDDQTRPETDDDPAVCAGSPANPTAPAGIVCIYVAGGDNAVEASGWSVLPGIEKSQYGFKLGWTNSTAGDTFIDAVWAYQAP